MRKIQVIGNVTRDAEVRTLDGGRSVINFDLACNERYKDKNGEKRDRVYYIKCAIWRESTRIAEFITKGTKVYVEGKPDVDCYVNKETGKAVGSVKVIVNEVEFLGGGKNQQQSSSVPSDGGDPFVPESNDGSDLPF